MHDRTAARAEISADEKYSSSLLKTNPADVSIKQRLHCGSLKLFVRACACNGGYRSLVFDAHERCAIRKTRRLRASDNPHDGRRMKRKIDVRGGGASARSERPACADIATHRNRPHSRNAIVQAASREADRRIAGDQDPTHCARGAALERAAATTFIERAGRPGPVALNPTAHRIG
ncbi:hypothetical protein [Lysobacter sp. TAB13]|uniref:hypothetical protein n=1 Tax=Lysobacter sp. TAB13 TaxID=3233065 RepID=UPI003F9E99C9